MESSPLSLLPSELRNNIYTSVFTSNYAVTLHNGALHPLTQTCRQARQETLDMYLSLSRFNAHLDDGPAAPLATWLRTLGPHRCLLLGRVNVWDLHMLNAVFHGADSTGRLLREGREGEEYALRPVGWEVVSKSGYLRDLLFAFRSMGLGLARFVIREAEGREKQTSEFAILPVQRLGAGESGSGDGAVGLGEEGDLIDQGSTECGLVL